MKEEYKFEPRPVPGVQHYRTNSASSVAKYHQVYKSSRLQKTACWSPRRKLVIQGKNWYMKPVGDSHRRPWIAITYKDTDIIWFFLLQCAEHIVFPIFLFFPLSFFLSNTFVKPSHRQFSSHWPETCRECTLVLYPHTLVSFFFFFYEAFGFYPKKRIFWAPTFSYVDRSQRKIVQIYISLNSMLRGDF